MTVHTVTAVLIVGGGPAGAAAAISLARRGFTPVVLEARTEPQPKIGECLPPTANPLLGELGLAEAVARVGLAAHGNRSIWGSAQPLERDFIFGAAGMGWQLDRRGFEEETTSAAIRAGADWRYGRRVLACSAGEHAPHTVTVKTEKGVEVYRADFVVDTSGRTARLARLLGQRRLRYDRLASVTACLQRDHPGSQSEDPRTLVEAVENGWWYSASVPGRKLVAAYMTDADLLNLASLRPLDAWSALLGAAPHTQERIRQGGYVLSGGPRVVAATTSRLSAVVGEAWLAAGDAAVAHDPLTSYGITAALGSGLYAGAAAADHLDGRHRALLDYAALVDRAFARYLVLHHDRYLLEQRWPESTFWRRRHTRSHA